MSEKITIIIDQHGNEIGYAENVEIHTDGFASSRLVMSSCIFEELTKEDE